MHDKHSSNPEMKLPDKMKKLKDGLKLHTYNELGEEKGKMPKTVAVEKDGQVVADYESKDGKAGFTSATQGAQESGIYEKNAKKAGVKKEDLNYTTPKMAGAQAAVNTPKDLDNDHDAEKAKLVKAEENKINYKDIQTPENQPHHWKQKMAAKSPEENAAFKAKLQAQRPMKDPGSSKGTVIKCMKSMQKALKINPKILSSEPTHEHKGVKVKHLKDIGNGQHTVEIMEGEHKGKWTQAHDNDMKKLEKFDGISAGISAAAKRGGVRPAEMAAAATSGFTGSSYVPPPPPPPPAVGKSDMNKTEWKVPGLVPVVPDSQKMKKNDPKEEHMKLTETLGREPSDEEYRDHMADLANHAHEQGEARMGKTESDDGATHTYKGGRVKSEKVHTVDWGHMHQVRFLDGPKKGGWNYVADHDLKPLEAKPIEKACSPVDSMKKMQNAFKKR